MKHRKILTEKQARFVDEYLVSLNGTRAAIHAGYSRKTARAIASENLKKPAIAAEIKRRMWRRRNKSEGQAERVIAELAQVAFANLADGLNGNWEFKEPKDWPPETLAAVRSYKSVVRYSGHGPNRKIVGARISVEMQDKLKALGLLLDHYGETRSVR